METIVNRNLAITQPAAHAAKAEKIEFLALVGVAVSLPLLLGHSAILTGAAVNAALALGAMRLSSWKRIAPLVLLPSVSAVTAGAIFGAPVWGLVALLPAIWAGNSLYAGILRGRTEAKAWFAGLAGAALAKAAVIGLAALALVALGALPMAVAAIVAPMQLMTAVIGGSLAWPAGRALGRAH